MHRVPALVAPSTQSATSRSTTTKSSSNLDCSWPPSATSNSLDYGCHFRSMIHSMCIPTFAQSRPPGPSLSLRPPCTSLNLLNSGPQIYLPVDTITVWWICGARKQRAHQWHSTPPLMASKGNWCENAILARVAQQLYQRLWKVACTWKEPQRLLGSSKARQECMGPRAGKDRVWILYTTFAQSRLPGPSLSSLHLGLHVHL